MRKILIVVIAFLGFVSYSTTVSAEESVEYDLEKGGRQEFVVENDGEEMVITVEEVFSPQKPADTGYGIQSTSVPVTNRSYNISGGVPGVWNASYTVDVNNQRITRAHNTSAYVVIGSFRSRKLTYNNSRATYELVMIRPFIHDANIKLVSYISNGRLYVTQ